MTPRKSPKPKCSRLAPCGKEFHGDPAATKKARDEHEAKCAKCHRAGRPMMSGREEE